MKTLLKAEIILLLACLLYCFAPLRCEAADYTITEAELTRLETNLTQLAEINNQSQTELQTLREQLTVSQEALTKAKQQSAEQQVQLQNLKAITNQQENLLQSANKSLNEYEAEMKEKQRSLERQRNIAYVIAVCMLCVAVR